MFDHFPKWKFVSSFRFCKLPIDFDDRGKGSEIILQRPTGDGSKKGPQYTLKNHGKNTELGVGAIKAILRRFDIDRSDFLNA